MTGRERRIFATIVDFAVAPAPPLPRLEETDAVAAFERYLKASPPANRAGLRAVLFALELAPMACGRRRPLTHLAPEDRDSLFAELLRGPMAGLVEALRALAHVSYYGDRQVLQGRGYDANAVVERGRALRAAEGRW